MNALDKFLVIEKKVNEIFKSLLDTSLTEGERLSAYLEQKTWLEKIKGNLKQVTETEDIAVKEKASNLLKKIDQQLTEFGQKYLNIGSETAPVTTSEPVITEATESVVNNTDTVEKLVGASDYILVEGNTITKKMNCTKQELVGYLNANYSTGMEIPSIFKVEPVKLRTKTVYDI